MCTGNTWICRDFRSDIGTFEAPSERKNETRKTSNEILANIVFRGQTSLVKRYRAIFITTHRGEERDGGDSVYYFCINIIYAERGSFTFCKYVTRLSVALLRLRCKCLTLVSYARYNVEPFLPPGSAISFRRKNFAINISQCERDGR